MKSKRVGLEIPTESVNSLWEGYKIVDDGDALMGQPHWTMLTCHGPMVPVRTVAPTKCNTTSQHCVNVCKVHFEWRMAWTCTRSRVHPTWNIMESSF
jgi:hypothetical protein